MGPVIGEILPLAIGIAISPVPIIAAVLMLLSPKAKSASLGFLVGWLAGIVVAIVLFTLLSSLLPEQDSGGSSPVAGVIKIILGALLLLLALKQWRSRPAEGAKTKLPKWMAAIDSMTAGKALALAFLLAAVNPKNLLFAISAGVFIGSAGLTVGQATVVIVVFVLLAGCTVLIPVLGYFLASARMAGPLDRLRGWLVDNNNAIMAVLLLVMGVSMIGKGISTF
jgi:threonine/homoserine/homoserine lactone efflux protein